MEMSEFRKSIEVNLLAYVHFAKLFLEQSVNGKPLHLVNVNSIAGHCACQANSDYCASKYGLHGFTDALRHELPAHCLMTNFYHYYVDTGLFRGFKPVLGFLVPMLNTDYVANRIYQAILAEEQEVYIPSIIELLKNVFIMVPLTLRNFISHHLVGKGMDHYTGRTKNE